MPHDAGGGVVGIGLPIAYPVGQGKAYPMPYLDAYLGLVVHEVRYVVDRIAYLAYLALALDRGDASAGEAYLLAYLVPTSTRKQDGVPLEFLDDSPTPRGLFAFISFHGFERVRKRRCVRRSSA
jgi:ABC-type amino acid transport substrate-binding protein